MKKMILLFTLFCSAISFGSKSDEVKNVSANNEDEWFQAGRALAQDKELFEVVGRAYPNFIEGLEIYAGKIVDLFESEEREIVNHTFRCWKETVTIFLTGSYGLSWYAGPSPKWNKEELGSVARKLKSIAEGMRAGTKSWDLHKDKLPGIERQLYVQAVGLQVIYLLENICENIFGISN